MLVNLKSIIDHAYDNNYALGSFNCYNLETFQGAIEASAEQNLPVIVAFGEKYQDNMDLETAYNIVKSLAEKVDIPVCLHLDHCKDMDTVFKAISIGFGSVMYDGSNLPFEENLENTKLVTRIAHSNGVSVEAELGSLAAGLESHEASDDDIEKYTDPEAAKKFIDETNVDALAVSIGTVHGLYKGEPKIRVDILERINELCKKPLVLHGGSGTPEQDLRSCIANGIAKINVNTEISNEVITQTKDYLQNNKPHFSELSIMQKEVVKKVVKKYIEIYKK